jgi:hypothetical protein
VWLSTVGRGPAQRQSLSTPTHHADTGELYDIGAGPTEKHSRWDDPEYADVKADLLARLTGRMVETVDPLGNW